MIDFMELIDEYAERTALAERSWNTVEGQKTQARRDELRAEINRRYQAAMAASDNLIGPYVRRILDGEL